MIHTTTSDGRCTITLDRTEVRNAIDGDGWRAFEEALRQAEDDTSVHLVLLTGAGATFCAGQDLREAATMTATDFLGSPAFVWFDRFVRFPKPIVAAVDGDAVGVGTTMLLHIDFVVASTTARFRAPFVHIGGTAEAASSVLLAQVVGARAAARLLYLGDWIDARDAHEIGLVSELVEGSPLPAAEELCDRLLRGSPASLASTRRLLVAARLDAVRTALARERAEIGDLLRAPDVAERLQGPLARR